MTHLDLAAVLNLISTVAIVGALIFTGLQVRTANRTRADQAAVIVIQTTQSSSWIESLELITTLPENAEPALVDEAGKAMAAALFTFDIRLETIGYMVYCRIITLKAVDDLIGGVVMVYWSRAAKWMQRYRDATNNPKIGEWSEWLVDQIMARRTRAEHGPAQVLYRDWRE
jgi:hypothetical protein